MDWQLIALNAQRHGVSSLLYYNLNRLNDADIVPEKIMKYLRSQYYSTMAKNMRHYDELRSILYFYKDAGIDVIVQKGPMLAENVYCDIGLRGFNDIDILVRKNDLQKAKKIAIMAGYSHDALSSPEAINEKFGYNLHYFKNIILEIHWDIARKTGNERYLKINVNELWKNAVHVKISNVDALMLAPEDMLFHLCIHLAGHRYSRLIWFTDISEIINQYDIDWEYMLDKAEKRRAKLYLFYGLKLTSELLGTDIPGYVLERLEPNYLERKLFQSINRDIVTMNKKNGLYQITPLFKLLLIDRSIDRMKFVIEYFFPPVELIEQSYSASGSWVYFYYITHPLSLIKKGFRRLAGITRGVEGL